LNPVTGEEMTVGMSARTTKKDGECIFDIFDKKRLFNLDVLVGQWLFLQ
jgi:hypothetical protein